VAFANFGKLADMILELTQASSAWLLSDTIAKTVMAKPSLAESSSA
jgi:hypothetical protein